MATVKELIEQLSKLDSDLHVYFNDASYGMSEIEYAEVKRCESDLLTPHDPTADHEMIVHLH